MVSKSATKAVVLCISLLLVLTLTACRGGEGEVKIPVDLKNASNVGSLHIELVYDSAVLEATEVKVGNLARNAAIEFNLGDPGRVIVAIIDAMGINGDGPVVTVSFNVVGEGMSSLTLENVEAYDAETLYDIITAASPGNFVAKDNSFTAPVIVFK